MLLLLAGCTAADADPRPGLLPVAVTAEAVPLNAEDPARDTVGRLKYLGGIELKSADARFGGLSGLRVTEPGKLLSITDGGHWISLGLDERGDRLMGLKSASMDIVRVPQREPLMG